MKRILILLVSSSVGQCATWTVCPSGCYATSVQAAYNAASPGDTVILTPVPGVDYGDLVINPGSHDITFKSSLSDIFQQIYGNQTGLVNLIKNALPPAWGSILAPWTPRVHSITISVPNGFGPSSGPTITNNAGTAPFVVGDLVYVRAGEVRSGYYCASLNMAPYVSGECNSARVGFINVRQDTGGVVGATTGLSNGMIIRFMAPPAGQSLPSPLVAGTSYYVVNFFQSTSSLNTDDFQIALTPGGSPIALSLPANYPTGTPFNWYIPALPFDYNSAAFVTNVAGLTFQVGQPNGSGTCAGVTTPVTITQQSANCPAGTGIYQHSCPSYTKDQASYNLTFDGLEVTAGIDQVYSLVAINDPSSVTGEAHDLKFLRMYVHGSGDQYTTFPLKGFYLSARSVEVGYGIIADTYSNYTDTQGIWPGGSTGDVNIHDNMIVNHGENIMIGGSVPWFLGTQGTNNFTGMTFVRNMTWKFTNRFNGITATYIDGSHFYLTPRYSGPYGIGVYTDCAAAAADPSPSWQCLAYSGYDWPFASSSLAKYFWSANQAASTFTVTGSTAGQKGFIYVDAPSGTLKMDHNFSGTVTCPSGVVCTPTVTPAYPYGSSKICTVVIQTGGTLGSNGQFQPNCNSMDSKNMEESKGSDNWTIVGNVHQGQTECDFGGLCQPPFIQATIATNGSGPSEAVNYNASSSYWWIANNIFRLGATVIIGVGASFSLNGGSGCPGSTCIYEYGGFGKNVGTVISNNLSWNIGSKERDVRGSPYAMNLLAIGTGITGDLSQPWVISHNTFADAGWSAFQTDKLNYPANFIYKSNVLTPFRSACSSGAYCNAPAATDYIGFQQANIPLSLISGSGCNTWVDCTGGSTPTISSASQMLNNIVMNRPLATGGYTAVPTAYPTGTYLLPSTSTIGGSNPDPSLLFTTWVEPINTNAPNGLNYRASNFRILPTPASLFPATDSRTIGADIDEIEALTGQAGADVENGVATFAQQSSRQVSAGSTTAVLSYLPNGSACTIQVWPNSAYSGTPAVNISDSTGQVITGTMFVPLVGLSASTPYWGKRWCGGAVDVFNFVTYPSTPGMSLQFAPAAGVTQCRIDYGATSVLGSSTTPVAVSGGTCLVSVPVSAFWQPVFLTSGTVVSSGPIQRRGL